MKSLLKILSACGLALTLFPSFFVFAGTLTLGMNYMLMAIGMVLWFGTAPFWMKPTTLEDDDAPAEQPGA